MMQREPKVTETPFKGSRLKGKAHCRNQTKEHLQESNISISHQNPENKYQEYHTYKGLGEQAPWLHTEQKANI
jgi:hypothetical protein